MSEPPNELEDLRRLCLALFGGTGITAVGEQPRPSAHDIVLATRTPTAVRQILVRLSTGPPTPAALDDLKGAADDEGCLDYLLMAVPSAPPQLANDVHVLAGASLTATISASWLVNISATGHLSLDREAWTLLGRIEEAARPADARLLRELLTFSVNVVPPGLETWGPADEQFEVAVYRFLTGLLALEGQHLGSSARGQRVPDALIGNPNWSRPFLIDAKASRSAYRMDIDDERRLIEYATQRYAWRGELVEPAGVLIVSSSFGASPKRAYADRRAKFQDAGSDLIYVTARDFAASFLTIDNDTRYDTTALQAIDWRTAFAAGLLDQDVLEAAISAATNTDAKPGRKVSR